MTGLSHFEHNINFPEKSKTVTLAHSLTPFSSNNFRKN